MDKMERENYCIPKEHLIPIHHMGNTTITNKKHNLAIQPVECLVQPPLQLLFNRDVLVKFFASIYLGLNSMKQVSTNNHSTSHTVQHVRGKYFYEYTKMP